MTMPGQRWVDAVVFRSMHVPMTDITGAVVKLN
jgi:hypothetical protein